MLLSTGLVLLMPENSFGLEKVEIQIKPENTLVETDEDTVDESTDEEETTPLLKRETSFYQKLLSQLRSWQFLYVFFKVFF